MFPRSFLMGVLVGMLVFPLAANVPFQDSWTTVLQNAREYGGRAATVVSEQFRRHVGPFLGQPGYPPTRDVPMEPTEPPPDFLDPEGFPGWRF